MQSCVNIFIDNPILKSKKQSEIANWEFLFTLMLINPHSLYLILVCLLPWSKLYISTICGWLFFPHNHTFCSLGSHCTSLFCVFYCALFAALLLFKALYLSFPMLIWLYSLKIFCHLSIYRCWTSILRVCFASMPLFTLIGHFKYRFLFTVWTR